MEAFASDKLTELIINLPLSFNAADDRRFSEVFMLTPVTCMEVLDTIIIIFFLINTGATKNYFRLYTVQMSLVHNIKLLIKNE